MPRIHLFLEHPIVPLEPLDVGWIYKQCVPNHRWQGRGKLRMVTHGVKRMFMQTRWVKRKLAVPLDRVKPVETAGEKTREAVVDWQYWVAGGYEF
jgi:hypothetical protein